MLINLRVIFGHGDALKVAAVMITMALTGKWIACWLTQKIYKMSVLERNLMYGLSNAQAAATLAAVLVGYNIILPTGERLLTERHSLAYPGHLRSELTDYRTGSQKGGNG